MLIETEIDQVLSRLGDPRQPICDEVVPALQPELPTNCYRAEYAWQHSYERSLLRRARDWIGAQRHELIGTKGLLSEALSNAYVHGNQRDPSRPITVELTVGQKGYVLRVAQSGTGFDYKGIVAKYRRREHYYFIGGNGLRKLDDNRAFYAFYGDGGCSIHLWYSSQD